jgi:hypothetical protein
MTSASLLPTVSASMYATVPFGLRSALETILENSRVKSQGVMVTLMKLRDQLEAEAATLDPLRNLGHLRPHADVARKQATVAKAIERLETGAYMDEVRAKVAMFMSRFIDFEAKSKKRRQEEITVSQQSETRYLPAAPMDARNMLSSDIPASFGASSLASFTTAAHAADLTSVFTQEAKYAFGEERRPVELTPFDMCPKCRVAMRHNQNLQQLVCPVPGCTHWRRFADMTSTALAYGEEVEFCKYTYRPVSHLDDTMKFAEAAESYVVPATALQRVMKTLRRMKVKPEDITIPMIRQICVTLPGIKMENTVQIYSRLSGRAPRRMTAFMKDQMRIMFFLQEVPYRKHCAGRTNNLSFPFNLYKYCELLGYWEMLETFPLLRGTINLSLHDGIMEKVCQELSWEFVPTVTAHMD